MWYLSLNISIKVGLSTKLLNLPILNKWKRENARGDNGVMKNDGPRRFPEEIKKNSKLKLTWTKAGTNLRNPWEDFWKFLENMMDDLMVGVSLNVWVLWRFWTMIKKRKDNSLMSLYIRDWKWRGFILPKSWREIRSVGSKSLHWLPKTQRHPRYLMTLREFRSIRSNGEMTKITSLRA